jgi:quercetin dioxygenase-like cupin family protein
MKKTVSVALLAAAFAIGSLAFALDEKPIAKSEHVMFSAADLKWSDGPPALPPGAKIAVLTGDPGKAGPFTIRLKFPAGYKVAPHTHPTVENVTVVSGAIGLGSGAKFDETAGHEMAAGGFAVMPAGMEHFAWCKSECVVQVHSTGPFEVKYVNPADDPRSPKK